MSTPPSPFAINTFGTHTLQDYSGAHFVCRWFLTELALFWFATSVFLMFAYNTYDIVLEYAVLGRSHFANTRNNRLDTGHRHHTEAGAVSPLTLVCPLILRVSVLPKLGIYRRPAYCILIGQHVFNLKPRLVLQLPEWSYNPPRLEVT